MDYLKLVLSAILQISALHQQILIPTILCYVKVSALYLLPCLPELHYLPFKDALENSPEMKDGLSPTILGQQMLHRVKRALK